MKLKKEDLLLYAITDSSIGGFEKLKEDIIKAIDGGITILQLREKNIDEEEYIRRASVIKKICNERNVLFIVNDNVNVALKSGADGVHVGISDMDVKEIRKLAGDDFIIGATAKTVKQAKDAYDAGADYLGVGAVFSSGTKKDAIRISKEELNDIVTSVSIPSVAIGGINKENIKDIGCKKICGVALVNSIFGASDICAETKKLKEEISTYLYEGGEE